MPLYEYSCQNSSRIRELLVRGDEKPVYPHCESTKLAKLTIATVLQLSITRLNRAWG